MQTLKRAFSILELLAKTPQEPRLLGTVAQSVGLAVPSCARILTALVKLGYVEKYGNRQGYILGPMAYALSFHGPYMGNLVNIAGPLVEKCATSLRESALLAILRQGQRYILCHANGNPDLAVQIHSFNNDDLYSTATGRLLLALAPEKERKDYILTHGLPRETWPGASSKDKLEQQIKAIRKNKKFIDNTASPIARFAVAVRISEQTYAALGINLLASTFRGNKRNAAISGALAAAREIEAGLKIPRKEDSP